MTATDLHTWLQWLGTEDCNCPSDWRTLGELYGISLGKGWVRISTNPECPHHGAAPS
jgi:hypothetical protein